jgi:hypothetical protein
LSRPACPRSSACAPSPSSGDRSSLRFRPAFFVSCQF